MRRGPDKQGYTTGPTLSGRERCHTLDLRPRAERRGKRKVAGQTGIGAVEQHGQPASLKGHGASGLHNEAERELAERSFAHVCETGVFRGTWLFVCWSR